MIESVVRGGGPPGLNEPESSELSVSRAVLAVSVTVFAFLIALTTVTNYDIWFHLAMGREILTRGFPVTDPFTYTQPASPPDLMSWMADVLFFTVWRLSGLTGLTLLKAAFSVALVVVLWRTSRVGECRGRHAPFVAATLIVVALFALKFRFFMRPHLFELLLLPWAVHLLHRDRWSRPMLLRLFVLQVLWTNLHGSFLMGLGLPVLFFAVDAARGLFARSRITVRDLRGFAVTWVAVFAATLVNPRGIGVFTAPAQLARWGSEMATLGEYQPLTWSSLSGFALQYTWGFSLLVVLGASALAVLVVRRIGPGWHDAVLFLMFLILPIVGGVRFIAEFAVVSTPILIRWWVRAVPPSLGRRIAVWVNAVLAVALVPMWWILVFRNPVYEVGLGEKEGKFPLAAVRFLEAERPRGDIFNSIGFGGYLMWNLPGTRVFIDGRVPVYPREFYRRYIDAHTDEPTWEAVQADYAPQVAVLEYLTDLIGKERMPVLEASTEWALVFWDLVGKVYVKRGESNVQLVSEHELRWALPAYYAVDHLGAAIADPARAAEAVAEYRRLLARAPANSEAALGLSYLLTFGPEPDWTAALDALRSPERERPSVPLAGVVECRALVGLRAEGSDAACAEIDGLVTFDPTTSATRQIALAARLAAVRTLDEAGVALSMEGRIDEALAKFDSAISLNRSNPVVYVNRGLMHEREGHPELALEDFLNARRLAPTGWPQAAVLEQLISDLKAVLARPQ
jgi:tetratricopeptide (TPR) repeat protein